MLVYVVCRYAGMLAVAKCGGPHIEFQPGRTDSAVFDPDARLPAPTEPLHHSVSHDCLITRLESGAALLHPHMCVQFLLVLKTW
jgi:hypothetical protein